MPLPSSHPRHEQLMQLAVRRSLRGVGRTRPNPAVGAVVAIDGTIVSAGHHARAGTDHAEVVALKIAGERARGADLYVTLEPCAHHGRTPPCVDAVIAAGIRRVFVACRDPNPQVHGRGIDRLRAAGVEVVEGLGAAQAAAVLAPFFRWITAGMPEVILKAAISIDGRIATHRGESAGMSGARAHAWLHRMRDRVDAILVGAGTVLADDPKLTPRRPPLARKGPQRLVRVVLDAQLRTPVTARLFAAKDLLEHPVWIFHGPAADAERRQTLEKLGAQLFPVTGEAGRLDLHEVLATLAARGVTSVLVEGGAHVHGSLLEMELATRAALVVTPRILGERGLPLALFPGDANLQRAIGIHDLSVRRLGDDTLFEGMIRYPEQVDAAKGDNV